MAPDSSESEQVCSGAGALPRWRRWANMALWLFLIWGFVFGVAPLGQKIDAVRKIHDIIEKHDIEATGLVYTEVEEFSKADSYLRDALRD